MPHLSEVTPAARRAASKTDRRHRLRRATQALSLVLLNPLALYRFRGLCLPVLNCHGCPASATTCPIGAFGSMAEVGIFPFLVLGTWGLVGALWGRLSCAWVCPFGLLQDLLARLPVPRWHPPRWLAGTKYAVLVVMVLVAAVTVGTGARWFFCGVCPAGTATAGIPLRLMQGIPVPPIRIAFLVGFLALMLFVSRGFCRLACPIGAGLALFNRFSLLRLRVDRSQCVACGVCGRACLLDEDPLEAEGAGGCIRCLECQRCPQGLISLGTGAPPQREQP